MERLGVPGVAVGVVHGDELEIAAFGVTSADNPLAVREDTLFQIGSITKTFLAAGVMRLVEDDRMELDRPVREYLPDFRLSEEAVAERVSMRHLLSHTGGWEGDYFASTSRGDDALERMVPRLAALPQLTPLGSVFSYNNAGFYVAGRVIEVITGEPFESALTGLVLRPLDLERTFLFPEEVLTKRFAVGHDRSGAVAEPWALSRSATAAGGLITDTRDLLRYARSFCDEPQLLSAASIAEMRTPQMATGHPPGYANPLNGDAVGLSWFLFEQGDRAFITHSGGTNGQIARLTIAPESRFALVVLTNQAGGEALSDAVQERVLNDVLGVPARAHGEVELTRSALAEYAGEYRGTLQSAWLSVENGRLVQHVTDNGGFPEHDSPPGPPSPAGLLAFEARDAAVGRDDSRLGMRSDFLRGPSGEIEWYRLDGRLLRRVR